MLWKFGSINGFAETITPAKIVTAKTYQAILNYIYSTSDRLFTRAAIYFPVASDELILGRAVLDLADLHRGSLGLPQQHPKQWPIFSPKLSVLIDLDMTTILPQYCYNVYNVYPNVELKGETICLNNLSKLRFWTNLYLSFKGKHLRHSALLSAHCHRSLQNIFSL